MRAESSPSRSVEAGVRALAMAAAILGSMELILHRVAAPVLSHIPDSTTTHAGSAGVIWAGERAFAATAALVVAGTLAAGVVALRARRPIAVPVLGVGLLTLAGGWSAGEGVAFGGHLFVIGALALAAIEAARRLRGVAPAYAFALAVTALGLAAAQWPLLTDAWLAWLGQPGSGSVLGAWTLAEAALVAAPVAFAIAMLLHTTPSRLEWSVATAAALGAGAFLGAEPGYAGLLAIWATGTTLALPAFAYVLSATCAGLVLAHWVRDPGTRHLAAGFVLLAVAGVQPAVVHHNLTAVFALLLLSQVEPVAVPHADAAPKRSAMGGVVGALE